MDRPEQHAPRNEGHVAALYVPAVIRGWGVGCVQNTRAGGGSSMAADSPRTSSRARHQPLWVTLLDDVWASHLIGRSVLMSTCLFQPG